MKGDLKNRWMPLAGILLCGIIVLWFVQNRMVPVVVPGSVGLEKFEDQRESDAQDLQSIPEAVTDFRDASKPSAEAIATYGSGASPAQGAGLSGDELEPNEAFSAELADLVRSLDHGDPLSISLVGDSGEVTEFHTVWRPFQVTSDNFRISAGPDTQADWGMRVYRGQRLDSLDEPSEYSLAIVQGQLAGQLTDADGSRIYFRSRPGGQSFEYVRTEADDSAYSCQLDPVTGRCVMLSQSGSGMVDAAGLDWSQASQAYLAAGPEILEQGGFNPQGNQLEKYVQVVPSGDKYERSLKPMFMLGVLDKQATGGASAAILQLRTSEMLAMISNVASVYENQLGIRLYLQELILTPNSNLYIDVPGSLEEFGQWCEIERPQGTFRWSTAVKWGNGLSGSTLGVAFLRTIQTRASVAIMKTGTGWATVAHEIGHNLGSDHSSGGIMNAFDNGGGNRDFFTDVTPGETAAMSIFRHAASRLPGTQSLRHPEQIPFARNDSARTNQGESVSISVLDNDRVQVRNGQPNQLSLEEVSRVYPLEAGSVDIDRRKVVFHASPDFRGTAFFSYTVRGSVGNANNGWLHKGDVAVVVDSISPRNVWTLAPGESLSFEGQGDGAISIIRNPTQATVHSSPDESDLIVVRADPDASGNEIFQYRQGNSNFSVRLIYDEAASRTVTDVIVWDKSMGSVTLNPLANDQLAGRPALGNLTLSTGIGTPNRESVGVDTFGWSSWLVSARLMDSSKGRLSTERIVAAVGGRPRNVLTGNLTFTPDEDARGLASIEYVVEDAALRRMTNYVSFVLPLGEVLTPSLTSIAPENSLKLEVETFPSDVPPLTGEVKVEWSIVEAPDGAHFEIEGHDRNVAWFTSSTPGFYSLSVRVSDSDFVTEDKIAVMVIDPADEVVLPPRLTGSWSLDELVGATFPDSGLFSRPMYHRNVDLLLEGIKGAAPRLNGNDEYLRIGPHANVLRNMAQGTLSLWFRTDSDGEQTLFSSTEFASPEEWFELYMQEGVFHLSRKESSESKALLLAGGNRYDDDQWHHLALSSDASGHTRVFVDGGIEMEGYIHFLRGIYGADEINLGALRLVPDTRKYWDGGIDEVRLFSTSLGQGQIRSLMGRDLPFSGIISPVGDFWVLPTGSVDPSIFGYHSLSDDGDVSDAHWVVVDGGDGLNTDNILWSINQPGDYIVERRQTIHGATVARKIHIQAVSASGANQLYAWAVPQVSFDGLQESIKLVDISSNIRDLVSGMVPDEFPLLDVVIKSGFPNGIISADAEASSLSISVPQGIILDEQVILETSASVDLPEVLSLPIRIQATRADTRLPDHSIEVRENTPPGTPVYDLQQSVSPGEPAWYRISSGNAGNIFSLDDRQGIISISEGSVLDFEKRSAHHLNIEIYTAGGIRRLTLHIQVRDVNEPFTVNDQVFQLSVSSEPYTVGFIRNYDPERTGLNYRIVEGDILSLFEIENGSGRLTLTLPEALAEISDGVTLLTIEASDPASDVESPKRFQVSLLGPVKVIDGRTPRTILVPQDDTNEDTWMNPGFDDRNWISGMSGTGYERGNGYAAWIGTDIESSMFDINESVYIRIPFSVDQPDSVDRATLRMFYDDGFVAWINGTEVASANAPDSLTWDSGATQSHSDTLALLPSDFELDVSGLLRDGTNILAIQGLNNGLTSSDMLIYPELLITRVPSGETPVPASVEILSLEQEGPGRVVLTGQIRGGFGSDVSVKVLYGQSPGGIEESDWDHTVDLGFLRDGIFKRSLTGFAPEGLAYFRALARNPAGPSFTGIHVMELSGDGDAILVSTENRVTFRVPNDASEDGEWISPSFDDSNWSQGYSALGYDSTDDYHGLINTDLEESMRSRNPGVYTRFHFDIPEGFLIDGLELGMMYDDGFAAYLNGVPVASENSIQVDQLAWNSQAVTSQSDDDAVIFEFYDLSTHIGDLIDGPDGRNVLAVHGLNVSAGSSDFLLRPMLRASVIRKETQLQPIDSDMDSLPDDWELENLGQLAFDGFDDPDGNGDILFLDFWNRTSLEGFIPTPGGGDDTVYPTSISYDEPNGQVLLVVDYPSTDGLGMPAPGLTLEFSTDLVTWQPWENPSVTAGEDRLEVTLNPQDFPGNAVFFRFR